MSPKTTLMLAGAAILAAWYVERKIAAAASSAKDAVFSVANGVAQAVGQPVIATYDAATAPVIPVSMNDPKPAQVAASVGNGIVAAPANTVDMLSMGLISGSGGPGGNGGIGGMLWDIISGNAFKPVANASGTPDPTFDLGNSTGW